ncbi:TPA: hypothetical protein PI874_002600 [Staphylococcus aureus]|nr:MULTISPECIES: hypothetical protein [Staphylococcus]MCO4356263.1 hypothetical protein [Staphylococcus agnetis]NDP53349.1 hypothetical protein [Staphylococcus aureus]NDQ34052.1 hypothetical protein [Staphylococcus aureus]NDQ44682.1 hypothetical protein [Staphylococcus aureus]NJI14427.1 hypothetical protein [Staphylococcus agnetis]
MKIKILIANVIALSTIAITVGAHSVQAQEGVGSRINVDTLTDEKSKMFA